MGKHGCWVLTSSDLLWGTQVSSCKPLSSSYSPDYLGVKCPWAQEAQTSCLFVPQVHSSGTTTPVSLSRFPYLEAWDWINHFKQQGREAAQEKHHFCVLQNSIYIYLNKKDSATRKISLKVSDWVTLAHSPLSWVTGPCWLPGSHQQTSLAWVEFVNAYIHPVPQALCRALGI